MRVRKFTRQVGSVISEETYTSLIAITDKNKMPVSEFIRKVLEEKFEQLEREGERDEY